MQRGDSKTYAAYRSGSLEAWNPRSLSPKMASPFSAIWKRQFVSLNGIPRYHLMLTRLETLPSM